VLFYVVFVCKCVLPPGDNPIAVNKYILLSTMCECACTCLKCVRWADICVYGNAVCGSVKSGEWFDLWLSVSGNTPRQGDFTIIDSLR
jgi:hypothetical protein